MSTAGNFKNTFFQSESDESTQEDVFKEIYRNYDVLYKINVLINTNKSLRLFNSSKNKELFKGILQSLAVLQQIFISIQDGLTKLITIKEAFTREGQKVETLLNDLEIYNESQLILKEKIIENIKSLNKKIIISTFFDDTRVDKAIVFTKKDDGTNPGYTITNPAGTRFTIKQGNTVGNTLSEVFSCMVLEKIVRTMNNEDERKLIAHTFLTIQNPENIKTYHSIEERCRINLYAASQWSCDKTSLEVCRLFGLDKRIKAAGTRLVEDFKDLRDLNEACDLGLEKIVLPSALIVDFDLHTENMMLKINDSNVKENNKETFLFHLQLLQHELIKKNSITRQERLNYLKGIINILKELGADIYFHKIDHDSGFYRYADPERKVDFLTHRTSPVHRIGGKLKIQPTLHITEITGGTKEGMDQLLLSDRGVDKLLKINLDTELDLIIKSMNDFFDIIHEKSLVLMGADNEPNCLAAEFYLLNEFYYHIKEERMLPSTPIQSSDIDELKNLILLQLNIGTHLKVKDLYEQVYQRLLEIDASGFLTAKQHELKLLLEKQVYLKNFIFIKDTEISPRNVKGAK